MPKKEINQNVKTKSELLKDIESLLEAYQRGQLGGQQMPEDSKPNLPRNSEENLLYLTLPMALNYQRNSYKLWESALSTWNDPATHFVFEPNLVIQKSKEELRMALVKHKVALQPNKQPIIWSKICNVIVRDYNGHLSELLEKQNYDIARILNLIQVEKKPDFPYLSGNKIANYWLYVLTQYTDLPFVNRSFLSIAPDTHICQASVRLGLAQETGTPATIAQLWSQLLEGSNLDPIDIHTPLWLWSRSGFEFEL
jgi:hypothetical protein